VSKSFEQIFSESNPHGFKSYEGPCTCCEPKSTDKVTKAYARGVQEERKRITDLLKTEEKRLYDHANIGGSYLVTGLIELIKGENK
jgi:hypothetical protein